MISTNDVDALLQLSHSADHTIINKIESFVEKSVSDFSGSQLRQLYNKIKASSQQNIPLLRAKLAYAKGRTEQRKKGMLTLIDILNEMMKKIDTSPESKTKLSSLKAFMESIICYYAAHGGDQKS